MTEKAEVKVKMTATGVIKDKFGNIKSEVTITGEASKETWDRFTGKGNENGCDSSDGDSKRAG